MHLLTSKTWHLSYLIWSLECDIIWQDWNFSINPTNCQYTDIGQALVDSERTANVDRLRGSH